MATAAAGAAAALPAPARAGAAARPLPFGPGDGADWGPGWRTVGVANLRRRGGRGVLEAGSDVFPNDPRPVAFAVDRRFRDGQVTATIERTGLAPGVVARRTAPRAYYAAIFDTAAAALVIVRRRETSASELARVPVPAALTPVTLALAAHGVRPTRLTATLSDAAGRRFTTAADDSALELQRAGDPGVLATAQTFLATAESVSPALGGARLGLGGTQEGQTLAGTPVGRQYEALVRGRSTAEFRTVTVATSERPGRTPASVVAATSGWPSARGGRLAVSTDLPARVTIELSYDRGFDRVRRFDAGRTGDFGGAFATVRGLVPGRRVYWRARVRRGRRETVGPVRSFRTLPTLARPAPVTVAVGACGSRFGPIFEHLAARRPDVFVWQGDLNYPDTHGPLAQTMTGYAGIWRDFLRNPRLLPVLERAWFAGQRDDHDYGVQDANSERSAPWGMAPWEALVDPRPYHRFSAGPLEVWVLDERRFKSPPDAPDTTAKTLLGARQRRWLFDTLAASRAPFKLICSPCTLFYGGNARDGNWDAGFSAERDLLLDHIAKRVSGRTLFVSGDAHDTMVYDRDGVFEARACPLDIPDPRDHPGVLAGMFGGAGVAYASTLSHFALLRAATRGATATLDLTLVDENGAEAYTRRFEGRVPVSRSGRRRRRRRRGRATPAERYSPESERSMSRRWSRSLIERRLSYRSLPRPSAISTLA